jgi:opacity protein-like surface antigen
MNYRSVDCRRVRARSWVLIAGVVATVGLLGSSGAMAQNCGPIPTTSFGANNFDWKSLFGAGLSGANALAATIQATNTAFLTQSTAFVSAPGNPKPDSEGGGIWVRGVGGDLSIKTGGAAGITYTAPGLPIVDQTGATTCNTKFQQSFGGFQLGQDVAKLNINGWNIHVGSTAGYLQTSGQIVGGNTAGGSFNTSTEAPFVGTYLVATQGNFFVDGLVRFDYYQTSLNSPSINVFNQKLDAYGYSASGSAGYHWNVPNSKWFIEPSVGLVWSDTLVNPLASAGQTVLGGQNFQGTTNINNMLSLIGRAGVRVGTSVETASLALQPFVAASVWHEFDGGFTATYSSCPNCIFQPGFGASNLVANMTGGGVGTFGQYSVGIAGQLKGTGWLGFARLDYRDGSHLEGLSGTGGIRYQFTPTEVSMPVKAKALPYDPPVSWSGFYAGAIGGVDNGHGTMAFPGTSGVDVRPAGILGGGTLGYNYQVGKWVYGVEGDLSWTGANASAQCAPLFAMQAANSPLFQMNCHDSLSWMATAAARLGYAWTPRTLVYGKVGGAWADETASMTCNLGGLNGGVAGGFVQNCVNPAGALVSQATASDVRAGWTVGFGTEFALTPRWSAKAEFDWISFGNKGITLSDGTAVNSSLHISQTKVGLNYKF